MRKNKFDNTVRIGKNVTIKAGVELHFVEIGDNVVIGKNTTIFGSEKKIVKIGSNCYISPNCWFNGINGIEIGEYVTFSIGAAIFTDSGPNVGALKDLFPIEEGHVKIGSNCWIGSYGILLPNTTMQDFSVLGANSMLKDTKIKSGEIFGGTPAKFIKTFLYKNLKGAKI
jgi:acetyltransferase-like isoleucine patch superfamily enzyme